MPVLGGVYITTETQRKSLRLGRIVDFYHIYKFFSLSEAAISVSLW